ncbi:glucose-6-phosphate dehydrogenase [Synechococcus sp. PCC 7336]|uniref:glucose-6-phosphate dehydrogenase n=1 Tax=Synechococcus sp. PCC 7336 TaxID=195250 RepID=UPI000345B172|nr:glucose-6-phosphate dehydrogenase [Synechococcus sp. PCC 7336]
MVALAPNPLRIGLTQERVPAPLLFVLFGASGDLAARKLIPAIYRQFQARRLPAQFALVGVARREWTHEIYREKMHAAVEEFAPNDVGRPGVWGDFASRLFYSPLNIQERESYLRLNELLDRLDREQNIRGNRVFYLSVSPKLFPSALEQLADTGMIADVSKNRIVIEKPFGRDLPSAQELNQIVSAVCDEKQVFRIDHYLGKETVQNMMVFRFANAIFEPLWNRNYIDHVQITVAETVGVEERAGYYDSSGALRDMLQNHLMQIYALAAMEPPVSLGGDGVRNEKVKVVQATRVANPRNIAACAVRGQYSSGWMSGRQIPGYLEEPDVNPESATPTFVAVKLMCDNWRWQGVPFYLRTGKRLPKKVSEIAIFFRQVPLLLFESAAQQLSPNVLTMRIQPDEGISLRFEAKMPGPDILTRSVDMDFQYGTAFGTKTADAYDRLLLDSMLGDQTLFMRSDEVEAAWRVVTPLLTDWEDPDASHRVSQYEAGTWGPAAAEELLTKEGRRWRRL